MLVMIYIRGKEIGVKALIMYVNIKQIIISIKNLYYKYVIMNVRII